MLCLDVNNLHDGAQASISNSGSNKVISDLNKGFENSGRPLENIAQNTKIHPKALEISRQNNVSQQIGYNPNSGRKLTRKQKIKSRNSEENGNIVYLDKIKYSTQLLDSLNVSKNKQKRAQTVELFENRFYVKDTGKNIISSGTLNKKSENLFSKALGAVGEFIFGSNAYAQEKPQNRKGMVLKQVQRNMEYKVTTRDGKKVTAFKIYDNEKGGILWNARDYYNNLKMEIDSGNIPEYEFDRLISEVNDLSVFLKYRNDKGNYTPADSTWAKARLEQENFGQLMIKTLNLRKHSAREAAGRIPLSVPSDFEEIQDEQKQEIQKESKYQELEKQIEKDTEGAMGGFTKFVHSFDHDENGYSFKLPNYKNTEGGKEEYQGTIDDFLHNFYNLVGLGKLQVMETTPEYNKIIGQQLVPTILELNSEIYSKISQQTGQKFNFLDENGKLIPEKLPVGFKVYYKVDKTAVEKYNIDSDLVNVLDKLADKNSAIQDILQYWEIIGFDAQDRNKTLEADQLRREAYRERDMAYTARDSVEAYADSLLRTIETNKELTEEQIARIRAEVDSTRQAADIRVVDAEIRYEQRGVELDSARTENLVKTQMIHEMNVRQDSTIADFQAQLDAAADRIITYTGEIGTYKIKVDSLENLNETLNDRIGILDRSIDSIETERDHYKELYESGGQTNESLVTSINTMNTTIDTLTEKRDHYLRLSEENNKKYNETFLNYTSLKSDSTDQANENIRLNTVIDSVKIDLEGMTQLYETAMSQIQDARYFKGMVGLRSNGSKSFALGGQFNKDTYMFLISLNSTDKKDNITPQIIGSPQDPQFTRIVTDTKSSTDYIGLAIYYSRDLGSFAVSGSFGAGKESTKENGNKTSTIINQAGETTHPVSTKIEHLNDKWRPEIFFGLEKMFGNDIYIGKFRLPPNFGANLNIGAERGNFAMLFSILYRR